MQASTWANGQPVVQPTHRSHFNPNTHNNNGSNGLYIISNVGPLVGHYAIQQTSAQRQNTTDCPQGYHPNSTQSPTLAYPPNGTVIPAQRLQVRYPQNTSMSHNLQNTFSMSHNLQNTFSMSHNLQNTSMSQNLQNTSMSQNLQNTSMSHNLQNTSMSQNLQNTSMSQNLQNTSMSHNLQNTSISHNLQNTSMSQNWQNTSMSQNPQSVSVPTSHMAHFVLQSMHQGLTPVNVKSGTENVPVQFTKPTSPSTTHAVYNTQQPTLVQSRLCSQSSQQTAFAPGTLPSYYEAVANITSAPHHVSSSQVHNVSPVPSTSCSNQPDQTNYVLPQTAMGCTLEEVLNGSGHRSTLQAVPGGHYKAYKIQGQALQAIVQVNSGVQGNIAASVGQPSPSSSWSESTPVPVQSQTQANMSTTKHVVDQSPNLVQLFYQKIFEKETVKASNGATQTSPSRAQRAVAIVLPLSQESSMEDNLSEMIKQRLLSRNPQKKNAQQHITESHIKETEKVDLRASHSSLKKMLTMVDKVPTLSHPPLTFSQLVKGIPNTLKKKKPGNGKTPKEQQSVAETSSSKPATEWTFQMLLDKIVEMEKENKKSEKVLDPKSDQFTVQQLLIKFWNGSLSTMVATANKGDLFNKRQEFTDLCSSTVPNTVVLSHTKSEIDDDRYHVLQHEEKVEKIPFTSSWLNTNPQLDDIDNEFGLPYFFTCAQRLGDWKDAGPQRKQNDKSPTGLQSEKSVEPMDNESNDTLEEICNESLDSKTKDCDENECDAEMLSSDSNYSFQIEILSPGKAKVIFEQENCDAEPQVEHFQAEETLPTDHGDAKKQTCDANSIETVCCLDKWKENVFGFSSEGKCKCNEEQSADNSLPSSIFDLTEENLCSPTAMEDIQEGSSPNSIIVLSESEDELQVLEKNQTSQSTDGPHVISSGENALETLKHLLNMADAPVGEISCEMQEQEEGRKMKENPIAEAAGKLGPSEIPEPLSHLGSQSTHASSSKCKKAAPKENVELARFGSNTGQMASTRTRRSHVCIFDTMLPPERIYVKLDPSSTSDKGAELSSNVSVRKRIHENWRKSFPLSTIKILKKNKKFSIVGAIPVPRFHKPDAKRVYSKRKLHDSNNPVSHKKTALSVGKTQNLFKTQNEVKSPQEGALKLIVLPDTFNFKEVSKNEDSRTDSAADGNTVIDNTEEQTPALKKQGLWREELGHLPQVQSSSSPESHGLFQEFKRRHKMKQKSPE